MTTTLKELTAQFLSQRYQLMGFIGGLVRDPAAAEDIFQEVWLRLSEAAERDLSIDDVPRWCRGVARNLILHYWREKRCSRVVADSELLQLVEQAFDEQAAEPDRWEARRQALVECLHEVSPHSRELLRLKYEQGLPSPCIAQQLGRTAAAVLMALCRVRQALARCIEERLRAAEEQS